MSVVDSSLSHPRSTLQLVLQFLYTGRIQESPQELGEDQVVLLLLLQLLYFLFDLLSQVQSLMNASDFYVVPALKTLCEDWLLQSLDTQNMVDRWDSS